MSFFWSIALLRWRFAPSMVQRGWSRDPTGCSWAQRQAWGGTKPRKVFCGASFLKRRCLQVQLLPRRIGTFQQLQLLRGRAFLHRAQLWARGFAPPVAAASCMVHGIPHKRGLLKIGGGPMKQPKAYDSIFWLMSMYLPDIFMWTTVWVLIHNHTLESPHRKGFFNVSHNCVSRSFI